MEDLQIGELLQRDPAVISDVGAPEPATLAVLKPNGRLELADDDAVQLRSDLTTRGGEPAQSGVGLPAGEDRESAIDCGLGPCHFDVRLPGQPGQPLSEVRQ